MAPALTEAASKAQIRISEPSAPPTPLLIGEGVDGQNTTSNKTLTPEDIICKIGIKAKYCPSNLQCLSLAQVQELSTSQRKGLIKKLPSDFSHNFVKSLPELSKSKTYRKIQALTVSEKGDNSYFVDKKMNKDPPVLSTNGVSKQVSKPEKCAASKLNGGLETETSMTFSGPQKLCHNSPHSVNGDSSEATQKNNPSETPENMVASMGNDSYILNENVSETCAESCSEEKPTTCSAQDISRKQLTLERRTSFLLRRLRRLQGKQVENHIRHQLSSFVNYQNGNLQTVAKSIKSSTVTEHKQDLFHTEDVKNLSTAALVNLVRQLQSDNNKKVEQQNRIKAENEFEGVLCVDKETCAESLRVAEHLTLNLNHLQHSIDSDATESSSGGESCDEDDCSYYDLDSQMSPPPLQKRSDWKWAMERSAIASRWTWLQAQVSDLEYRIRQQSEIHKQIRQTKGSVVLADNCTSEDFAARLRPGKDVGTIGDAKSGNVLPQNKQEASPACNISSVLMNVNMQASKLTKSLGTLSPASATQGSSPEDKAKVGKPPNGVINGGHEHSASSSSNLLGDSVPGTPEVARIDSSTSSRGVVPSPHPPDVTCVAARCRPVKSYRKRKLMKTAGLHQSNRKAARLSSVRCQCFPPASCPMCGGRYNNTQSVDPDTMPVQERVATLDSSFHPVLSFTPDIPLSCHFESLLKTGLWHRKVQSKSNKNHAGEKRRHKFLMSQLVKDRSNKKSKFKSAAALISSAKLRNKYERKTPTKKRTGIKLGRKKDKLFKSEFKRRRSFKKNIELQEGEELDLYASNLLGNGDVLSSPQLKENLLSSSCPSSTLKELKDATYRKRREHDYDINNIVIPYSMAASTRVEKLQYKEIVTPKWREIGQQAESSEEAPPQDTESKPEPDQPASEANLDQCEVEEDLSDDAFAERHQPCEVAERKRFSSFIHYPSRRARGSRGDDRGPTPVPLDIRTDLGISSSEALSPDNQLSEFQVNTREDNFRRRSSSASVRRMSHSFDELSTADSVEMVATDPWPERQFPLSEEEYNDMKSVLVAPVQKRRNSRMSRARLSLSSDLNCRFDLETSDSSRAVSPAPSFSSGSVGLEDASDPDWVSNHSGIDKPSTPGKPSSIVSK